METKDVYMTAEQVEELRAKVNAIEGVAELKAAYKARHEYFVAKTELERGDRDIEDMPAYKRRELNALEKKYPRAVAFIGAEIWASSSNPIKVRLGSRACQRILNGDDCNTVIEDMYRELDAFNTAQEG